jgi:hypothetical protein
MHKSDPVFLQWIIRLHQLLKQQAGKNTPVQKRQDRAKKSTAINSMVAAPQSSSL